MKALLKYSMYRILKTRNTEKALILFLLFLIHENGNMFPVFLILTYFMAICLDLIRGSDTEKEYAQILPLREEDQVYMMYLVTVVMMLVCTCLLALFNTAFFQFFLVYPFWLLLVPVFLLPLVFAFQGRDGVIAFAAILITILVYMGMTVIMQNTLLYAPKVSVIHRVSGMVGIPVLLAVSLLCSLKSHRKERD